MEKVIAEQNLLEDGGSGNLYIGIFLSLLCLLFSYFFAINFGIHFYFYNIFLAVTLLGFTTLGPYILTGVIFAILNTFLIYLFRKRGLTKNGLKIGYIFLIAVIVIALKTFEACC